jgi:hypothetical protein
MGDELKFEELASLVMELLLKTGVLNPNNTIGDMRVLAYRIAEEIWNTRKGEEVKDENIS